MRPGLIVLPEGIRVKVKGFGEGRGGATAKPKTEGFGPNSPGPPGFRAAGAHRAGSLGRSPATAIAPLLVDRRPAEKQN
jgi:hypothetical protein